MSTQQLYKNVNGEQIPIQIGSDEETAILNSWANSSASTMTSVPTIAQLMATITQLQQTVTQLQSSSTGSN